ncbi:Uma2 family endonuclease [Chroococcidiopsidales cyanobacterium LEGE 13417]|nr:Uma2 family endonuclease [Chroococcidiopsidales cyanobacterium LEGE 13417]
MTTTSSVVKPVSQMQLAPGSVVTIPNVSWQEFELILHELGEHRAARIAYSQNTLEIMVPLPEHERPKEIISDIIKILLRRIGKRYEPFGSTTFTQEGIAGVEPDACFYIQNYQPGDPPPDLAIEIDVTSKTTLDAYKDIGFPEIWVYDSGRLRIYLLRDGEYIESNISPIFPQIPLNQLISTTVERAWQVGSVQALEEFEEAIAPYQINSLQSP